MTRQVKTHIRLGSPSGSSSDQSPRCPHEETLGPYLPIAKFRGVSPQNVAEFLGEVGEISDFYFSPRKKKKKKKKKNTQEVFRAKREKKSFFLGLICISSGIIFTMFTDIVQT